MYRCNSKSKLVDLETVYTFLKLYKCFEAPLLNAIIISTEVCRLVEGLEFELVTRTCT